MCLCSGAVRRTVCSRGVVGLCCAGAAAAGQRHDIDTAELTLDITEGDPAPVAYLNVQAPNDYFFLIWTSSDPAVASVDGTGKVTGHAEGTAAVTARNERGEKTTCTITVRKAQPAAWC